MFVCLCVCVCVRVYINTYIFCKNMRCSAETRAGACPCAHGCMSEWTWNHRRSTWIQRRSIACASVLLLPCKPTCVVGNAACTHAPIHSACAGTHTHTHAQLLTNQCTLAAVSKVFNRCSPEIAQEHLRLPAHLELKLCHGRICEIKQAQH